MGSCLSSICSSAEADESQRRLDEESADEERQVKCYFPFAVSNANNIEVLLPVPTSRRRVEYALDAFSSCTQAMYSNAYIGLGFNKTHAGR